MRQKFFVLFFLYVLYIDQLFQFFPLPLTLSGPSTSRGDNSCFLPNSFVDQVSSLIAVGSKISPSPNMSVFKDSMTLLSGPPSTKASNVRRAYETDGAMVKSLYPLTHSQQGIWIEFTMDSLSTKYNLTLEWVLPAKKEETDGGLKRALEGERTYDVSA